MPDVPQPLPDAIGHPTPEGVFISKADWATLIDRDLAIREWMSAAASCLEAR